MRAKEFVAEAATSIVYHYTNTAAAAKILASGQFQLASSTGTQAETQYAIPGYPYFLSTTRSKTGDYHNRYVGSTAVMFVLNGAWLNNNYKSRPIDYWERSWLQSDGTRGRESEDRVYSRTPEIPANAKSIISVHVLIKEQKEYRGAEIRSALISAKTQGIPAYLYTDEQAWKLQNIRRAVSPADAATLIRGPGHFGNRSRPSRNYLEDWLELIYKKNRSELTASAAKKVSSLITYGSRYPGEDDGLGTDLSNARKPGNGDYASAVKINAFMRQNRLATPVDLKNYLVGKWDKSAATKSLEEVTIDNQNGAGAVPHNAEVDYFGLRVLMRPSVFLKLAEPLGEPIDPKFEKYIADGGAIGAPFLGIAIPPGWDDGDFAQPAKVMQHDGRNRMTIVMQQEGDEPMEVHLFPLGGYRARNLTADHVAALNQHLYAEKSNNVVRGPLFTVSGVKEAAL